MRPFALPSLFFLCLLAAVPPLLAQTPIPDAQPGEIVYVIQPGDTAEHIAARFLITAELLLQRNGLTDGQLPPAGARIIIPRPSAALTPRRILPTAAPTPTPAAAIPFELGGHVFSFSYPRQMRAAGMTWARSIVRYTRGASAEIAAGALDAAHSNGFNSLLTIIGDPAEMTGDLTRYIQEYATFLGSVAALRPEAIEVWTAPNSPAYWAEGLISPQAYAQMLALAYEAVKRVSPETLIIAGAPEPSVRYGGCFTTGCDDSPFIRALANLSAARSADCIGMRYTLGAAPPDATSGDPRGDSRLYYYPRMFERYVEAFPNKPICLVEVGYLAGRGLELADSFAWAARINVQNQAEWLARMAELARQTGRVRLMIVWNVDSTTFTPDNPESAYAMLRADQCLACITLGVIMGVR
jgi:hypothetical protein